MIKKIVNTESYFIVEDDDSIGLCFVPKKNWRREFINILKKYDISTIRLSLSAGWNDDNINFLYDVEGIDLKGIEIYNWSVKDLSPLSNFPNLEKIGLQSKFKIAPNFNTFKKLKIVLLHWYSQASSSVMNCNGVHKLNIVNYPYDNIEPLMSLSNLKTLQLTSTKLITLNGIRNFNQLEKLDLFSCSKLNDIGEISHCGTLTEVEFHTCKKIYDISALGGLTMLRLIYLINCGKIKSLNPISSSRDIKSIIFSGNTNILDGDMSCLLNLAQLETISFANKRHYSHTLEEVRNLM